MRALSTAASLNFLLDYFFLTSDPFIVNLSSPMPPQICVIFCLGSPVDVVLLPRFQSEYSQQRAWIIKINDKVCVSVRIWVKDNFTDIYLF